MRYWELRMRKYSPIYLALMVGLGGCSSAAPEGYIYKSDDPKYVSALSDAKRDYPLYFDALSESKSEKFFVGRQVFGKEVECVVFENHSSVIIEISLPIYCFKKGTNDIISKL